MSDPFVDAETAAEHDDELVAFEDLLERADAVTIHSLLTEDMRGMFDAEAFTQMKESAVLVNVTCGPIVDGRARRGEIAGAGLDVFPEELPVEDDPLRTHECVVATLHVTWYSEEANAERRRKAAKNVHAALIDE